MEDDLIVQAREDMEVVVEVVIGDLATIRTGRAKPSLVEQVQVEVYGTRMPLIELVTITAPNPHMIVIQPWDKSIIESINKSISSSDLNLNPVIDGNIIRIKIPPLTEERREEFVKLLKQKLESGRVLLRQVRQEIKKKIEDLKGQPGISEDDVHRLLDSLEKVTDEFMEKIEDLGEMKEEELRTI